MRTISRTRSHVQHSIHSARSKARSKGDAPLPHVLRGVLWVRAFVTFVSTFLRGTTIPKDRPLRAQEHLRIVLAAVLGAALDLVRRWGTLEGDVLAAGLCRAVDHLHAPQPAGAPARTEGELSELARGG